MGKPCKSRMSILGKRLTYMSALINLTFLAIQIKVTDVRLHYDMAAPENGRNEYMYHPSPHGQN